ncbi:kinase domain protein [Necator americanus]|uniref:Kinase domain protein n=1 Tax=Necator americanus TaxID=51031 RepID=W2TEB8_NECAM|nr:kinase domain protein [Necator americanus]ETN79546.1 kinase domain protein [Necator americanus]
MSLDVVVDVSGKVLLQVLKLLDVFCSRDSLSLVTEFIPFNLSNIISDPHRPQEEYFLRFFFRQIVDGMKYIHSLYIMHRVLKLLDVFCSRDSLSLVTEFIPFNLSNIISDPHRPQEEYFLRFFFRQIVDGMKYIHSLYIMHRIVKDLKPENILVTSHNQVKIADFGQACLFYPGEDREYEENVATRQYRAPELLFGCRHYTPAVDIWALGCILAEFVNVFPLFPGNSDIEQITRIFSVLGTPSEHTWPSWTTMPDAGKLMFENDAPADGIRIAGMDLKRKI